MNLTDIQKMVQEPYEKLGFMDRWELKELHTFIKGIFHKLTDEELNTLVPIIKNIDILMDIAEIGLFTEENGELLETIRKDFPLTSLEKVKGETTTGEECADIAIRLMNFCNRKGLNLEDEILKKHAYNSTRPYLHGKKV